MNGDITVYLPRPWQELIPTPPHPRRSLCTHFTLDGIFFWGVGGGGGGGYTNQTLCNGKIHYGIVTEISAVNDRYGPHLMIVMISVTQRNNF